MRVRDFRVGRDPWGLQTLMRKRDKPCQFVAKLPGTAVGSETSWRLSFERPRVIAKGQNLRRQNFLPGAVLPTVELGR